MSRLRVMIVDDHQMVREGIRMVLETENDLEVVGEAGEGNEAVAKAKQLKPDLILMDIMMPGMNGVDACQEVKSLLPECRVVMLTASGDEESVTASLVAGAQGFVLKAAGRDDLLRTIRAVGRGESVLDPAITRIVTEGFSRLVSRQKQLDVEQLTPREKEVLLIVVQGATNKEVADKLVISVYTARNMVGNILAKLGCARRSDLVRWAYEHGLIKGAGREM